MISFNFLKKMSKAMAYSSKVQLSESDLALAKGILNNATKIPIEDREFAVSIAATAVSKKLLSEKQYFWLTKMAYYSKADYEGGFAPNQKYKPPLEEVYVQEVDNIFKLMKHAAGHSGGDPTILITEHLLLKYTGQGKGGKKHPNHILLIVRGENGNSKLVGTVHPNGTTQIRLQNLPAGVKPQGILDLLADFNKDPSSAAASYGHQFSKCCFCSLSLTDETSVKVGYGPICAKKFGLPYGDATVFTAHGTLTFGMDLVSDDGLFTLKKPTTLLEQGKHPYDEIVISFPTKPPDALAFLNAKKDIEEIVGPKFTKGNAAMASSMKGVIDSALSDLCLKGQALLKLPDGKQIAIFAGSKPGPSQSEPNYAKTTGGALIPSMGASWTKKPVWGAKPGTGPQQPAPAASEAVPRYQRTKPEDVLF